MCEARLIVDLNRGERCVACRHTKSLEMTD